MGELQGIDHAEVLPTRMARVPAWMRTLTISFNTIEAAEAFDKVPPKEIAAAIVEVLRGR